MIFQAGNFKPSQFFPVLSEDYDYSAFQAGFLSPSFRRLNLVRPVLGRSFCRLPILQISLAMLSLSHWFFFFLLWWLANLLRMLSIPFLLKISRPSSEYLFPSLQSERSSAISEGFTSCWSWQFLVVAMAMGSFSFRFWKSALPVSLLEKELAPKLA